MPKRSPPMSAILNIKPGPTTPEQVKVWTEFWRDKVAGGQAKAQTPQKEQLIESIRHANLHHLAP